MSKQYSPAARFCAGAPVDLPPGFIVHVRGRGELFLRDTGGDGPPVLLLHAWLLTADVNWWRIYGVLKEAGLRVIAPDLRGHGRGIRAPTSFRLTDCAADSAELLRQLDVGPVIAVGYSMGGSVAQLMARDHPSTVAGLVLCASAHDLQDPYLKAVWASMSLLQLVLTTFPRRAWEAMLRLDGIGAGAERSWLTAELSRGNPIDLAQAGRELARYDARPWLGRLAHIPSAVVVTSRDHRVLPRKQIQLARGLDAPTFPMPTGHNGFITHPNIFRGALSEALRAVSSPQRRLAS